MKKILKLLVLMLISFSLVNNVYALDTLDDLFDDETATAIEQENNNKRENDNIGTNGNGLTRSESNNYGVNKKWNINSYNMSNVMRTPYVDASKKIYDFADILTDGEEKELLPLINEFTKKTNMDMVIVSIDMYYSYDKENEDYAADFYDYNDFGIDFDNYSGVLLLRNKYEEDPYFNVYTFGEAQLYFDYDRCESMLDNIYPYFKSREYLPGYKLFISDFTNYYNKGVVNENYYIDENGMLRENYSIPYGTSIISGAVASLLSILGLGKKNKMVKKAVNADNYTNKTAVNYLVNTDNLINSITTHHRISSDSSGSSFGGGSSIGSSGGGHGGGGGRHG